MSIQRTAETVLFYDQILHSIPSAVYVFDLNLKKLVFLNDYGARMFGYAPEEIQSSKPCWQDHIRGMDAIAAVEAHIGYVKTLKDGETAEMVNKILLRSGESIWVRSISSVCTRNDRGDATMACGFVMPLNNCDTRPAAHVNYVQGLKSTNGAVSCWEYDLATARITHVSDEVEVITGYTLADWSTGLLWNEVIEEEDRLRVAATVGSVLSSRGGVEVEFRMRRRDGATIWVRLNCCSKGGAVLFGTVTDISAARGIEDELSKGAVQTSLLNNRLVMALEEQQNRLAQYLHDDIGQFATAILMDLSWLEDVTGKMESFQSNPECLEAIRQLNKDASGILDSVRGKSRELFPAVLKNGDLLSAIEWQLSVFADRTGIACSFKTDLSPPLALSTEGTLALFRIFQEILTNTWKHAKATQINASLMSSGQEIVLRVKDNGVGIQTACDGHTVPYGVGMLSMLERARIIGAEFTLNSCPGAGVDLIITVPLTLIRAEAETT